MRVRKQSLDCFPDERPGAGGAGDVRTGSVLWGDICVPLKAHGPDQAAGLGSDWKGARSQTVGER